MKPERHSLCISLNDSIFVQAPSSLEALDSGFETGCLVNRWRVERFMQVVFAISATALFVPVIFHTATVSETDSLNKDAPGLYAWH